MSDTTTIEWTDSTWNPVTGCTKVSPGCDNCYAETFAERWRGTAGHHFENGFDITLRPNALTLPLRWRKPRKVFVNSMSDLFHKDVPDSYIARVFAVMALTPQHTYQVLTKRHGRMQSLVGSLVDGGQRLLEAAPDEETAQTLYDTVWPLPNVWLGVSVEDQKRADLRIPALVDTAAAVRFLSCEPLLGPVDLTPWMPAGFASWRCQGPDCRRFYTGPLQQQCPDCGSEGMWTGSHTGNGYPNGQPIGWVIVGGESGHGARPMSPDWARSLHDQCTAANVPFFFKQLGTATARELGIPGKGADLDLIPANLRVREFVNV
ncbi:phage Gp37/Gp68 family protein [Streptomyces pimonensis]|uniref:Phage Gp37/Gp68 family protein n=1 Tax=Streptomyces pimonensis TaxID=2860288 RepID=A0ABV4J2B0_9ACTN